LPKAETIYLIGEEECQDIFPQLPRENFRREFFHKSEDVPEKTLAKPPKN
jgi:hypothetical protein